MTSERFECLSCGGQYSTPQADGSIYFHTCPDLPGDRHNPPRRRPDGRDENVPAAGAPAGTIVAEGKGVKCLSNPKLKRPGWITERMKRRAEEASKDNA